MNTNRIVVVWILILSSLYSLLSILRHLHFQSGAFDLGIYDQAVWQYSRFLIPYNTIKERLILGDHLTLTLPLLAPLYWLWNDVKILLILQAFWLAFSSLAVYKLALIKKFTPLTSFILSFIYSLFYGFQTAVYFDFHPVVLGVGLIPWLVYFLESGKKKLFIASLILLLLTQEDMGLALMSISIIYLFKKDYRKTAILLLVLGLVTSLLTTKIVSLFSPIGFEYLPKISLNPVRWLNGFFDDPNKREVLFLSFSWFSFLPLLSFGSVLAVLFNLAQFFLTGPELARMWGLYTHHRAILAPLLLLGTLETLTILKKRGWNIQIVTIFMLAVTLFLQYFFHLPLNRLSKPSYWQTQSWMKDNYQILKAIPNNASVAAPQNLVPHLSHRKEMYLAWPRQKDPPPPCHSEPAETAGEESSHPCWWLDFSGKPEFLVVDMHKGQWVIQLLTEEENFFAAVSNMEKWGKITLVKKINEARLYKINY